MVEINWSPSEREKYQFVTIWLPASFCVLGGVIWWKSHSLHAVAAVWTGGFLLCLAGYLLPAIRRPLFVGLMVAGYPIGWTISHLVLLVVFYAVLTPIGLTMRIFGRDPMNRRFDRSAKSYWVGHNPGGDTARYFRQF